MKTLTYFRPPTLYEIKFGEGALHYLDVEQPECTKTDGTVKKWVKINGLRYYCVGWYVGMKF
jgi:hypothetical protein